MKTLVILPTFNESKNIAAVVRDLRKILDYAEILIVDDSSPDGTGQIADSLASEDSMVHVMHRASKEGLGSAYKAGFQWGIERSFDAIVEMDADCSHPSNRLPEMLELLKSDERAGVIIGSRWVRDGSISNWSRARAVLSRLANTYARIMLAIDVKDSTSGFRVYRASALGQLNLEAIQSRGYCFQIDMTLRIWDAGWRVIETPITFREREFGSSKMSLGIVLEAISKVTIWGIFRRARLIRPCRVSA